MTRKARLGRTATIGGTVSAGVLCWSFDVPVALFLLALAIAFTGMWFWLRDLDLLADLEDDQDAN